MKEVISHLKPIIITAIIAVVVFMVAWRWINAYKDVQKNIAVREARVDQNNSTVKANEQTVVRGQQQVDTGQAAISAGDVRRDQEIADLKKRLDEKPNSDQIQKIVHDAMPDLKGLQVTTGPDGKPYLSVPDTQENRDVLNKGDVAFRSCRFNLDDCENARKNYEQNIIPGLTTQITALTGTIAAQKDTIALKDADIRDLKKTAKGGNFLSRTLRVGIPIGCAGAGAYLAGKSQQGNNQGKAAAIGAVAGGGTCALAFHF